MTIAAFEQELKALNPDLSIMVAPNNPEMSGIYWRGMYICAIPSNHIYDEVKRDYKNSVGMVHRTKDVALAQVNRYLWRLQNEQGFMDSELDFSKDVKE